MPGCGNEDEVGQPSLDDLISLSEAATLTGLSYSHLTRLARDKDIWAKKIGNQWVTTEQAVRAYLAQDRRPGPGSKN